MEASYEFNRDLLQSHIQQWKRQQKRDRYPASERELSRQVGVSHTTLQNYRRGRDGSGRPITRMNYGTGLALSSALNIPLELLMPGLLAARTTGKAA